MAYYNDSFEDSNRRKIDIHWSETLWETHLKKHPELIDFKTTSSFIKKTISDPDVIMHGKRDGEREFISCYYKVVSRDRGFIKYIKVVVGCNSIPYYVKSVFCKEALSEFVVQERKYNQFKEIWKNPNSYL